MPWYTLYSCTLSSEPGDINGYNIRCAVSTSLYSGGAPSTGNKLRVTIQAGSTAGITWDAFYIGHAAASGDAWDFDGTQAHLLFSGSGGGTLATGASVVSDEVNYSFDKTKPLVIAMHFSAASVPAIASAISGISTGYLAASSQASVTNVSGYGSEPGVNYAFSLVEVFAGNTTLTAAAGSYTLTGTAAGFVTTGTGILNAAAGSYAIAGTAAGLGPGYQLTGFPATFVTGGGAVTLTAAAGSYALTGTAAALAYSATLTASAGSYALTGSAIGLGLGYKLTGADAAFVVGVAGVTTLPAAAGSYSLIGTAAAYRLTIAVAANSYALTGSDATLRISGSFVLSAAAGSYTLTGTAAAFIPPGPIEPTTPGGAGSVSRGRMIRKRRKREEQEEPIPVIGSTPVAEAPPGPSLPPQPGLMAHLPSVQPAKIPKRADPDEDEDEIALLLELIS